MHGRNELKISPPIANAMMARKMEMDGKKISERKYVAIEIAKTLPIASINFLLMPLLNASINPKIKKWRMETNPIIMKKDGMKKGMLGNGERRRHIPIKSFASPPPQ